MLTASITEAKNRLSALIDTVRNGETVVITDRGRPVAQLSSAADASPQDDHGRLARLERQGAVRRSAEDLSPRLISEQPPAARRGADILQALLTERAEGR